MYRFYTADQEGDNTNTIRFDGMTIRIEKQLPSGTKCLGWITDKNDPEAEVDREYVETKKKRHQIHNGGFNHWRYRKVGYAMVYGPTENAYVAICGWNTLPLLLLLIGMTLIIGGLCTSPDYLSGRINKMRLNLFGKSDEAKPEETIDTTQDAAQDTIVDHGNKPNINVEGSIVYQSPAVENEVWKAGSTEQDFLISNPKQNTDNLAGHIYVDLNDDGKFTEDECVYNPITYAEDGSVSSYGKFIAPGNELTHITILKEIPAGTYKASLQFTAVDVNTKTLDNSMNFDFDLTVE